MSSNRHQCLGLGEENRFCQERVWDRWVGKVEKVEEAVGKHQQLASWNEEIRSFRRQRRARASRSHPSNPRGTGTLSDPDSDT